MLRARWRCCSARWPATSRSAPSGRNPSAVSSTLSEIRRVVPKTVAVWAGGQAINKQPPTGITWLRTLQDVRAMTTALSAEHQAEQLAALGD